MKKYQFIITVESELTLAAAGLAVQAYLNENPALANTEVISAETVETPSGQKAS